MNTIKFFSIIFVLFLFNLFQPVKASAGCGEGEMIGCKYIYCDENNIPWGGRHSCYPVPQWNLCGCEDCQGPSSDRCITQGNTPIPDIPSLTPSPQVTGSTTLSFMGIKLGQVNSSQDFNIFVIIFSKIFSLFAK